MRFVFGIGYLYIMFISIRASIQKYNIWKIFGENEYLKESIMFASIAVIATVIVILFFVFVVKFANKKDKKSSEWFELELSKYGILLKNIKDKLQGVQNGDYLVLTNDNRLFVLNNKNKHSEEIKFNEILDVKLDAVVSEKNRMQIIALTPTFNKHSILHAIDFKLVTELQTYTIRYEPSGAYPDGKPVKNITLQQDDMNRFKLLLEREIEKLKNVN